MDSSVLFSGLRFDQKRFGADLQKFKRNDSKNLSARDLSTFRSDARGPAISISVKEKSDENSNDSAGASNDRRRVPSVELEGSAKKRKRRKISSSSATPGTTVSVFRPFVNEVVHEVPAEDVVAKPAGDTKARLAEEVGVLRKKHRLHVAGQSVPPPLVGFEQLKSQYQCKKVLMRRILEAGYVDPTPIQRQAIPILLERRECLACAPTGSGKTLAFMIPIAMNLKASSSIGVRAVVLCPVRELGYQTAREFRRLVPSKNLRVRALTTALFKTADFSKLPCDVLISTPLRLQHLVKKKKIDLSKVEYLIMDESDKLFEMGFVKQIDSIVSACSNPQIIRALFSATLPDTVEELARTIMHDAIRVIVGEKNSAASTVDQKLMYVGSDDGKLLGLRQMFKKSLRPPVLIFVESKERAKMLHRELALDNIKVDSIHSDKGQEQRNTAVEKFREGKAWVLIATDLMARGMDFKGVNCVINYDFPQTTATYIHRIGRSGRAGRSGEAVTLCTEKDVPYLRSVANVMRGAGCDVPEWMLSLRKVKVKKRRQ